MLKLSDISVVIPTYNRAKDLEETLKSLLKQKIREIVIVDQSKTDDTKKLISKLKDRKLKYVFSSTPAITIARNLGVRSSSKDSKIICFLDDDVTIHEDYFERILEVYNKYPEAVAVAGYNPVAKELKEGFLITLVKKIFFLGYLENKAKAKIISAYGNTYPLKLERIVNSQWLPGVNMSYKKEIFKELRFDEHLLGYTVAEDIDFSYNVYKKHKQGVFITPFAKVVHRISLVEREPTERISYINQIDHFYFNYKNLNKTVLQKMIFVWSLLGISILRPLQFLKTRRKNDYLKMKFYFKTLKYCLMNRDKIKAGRLREF